MTRTLGLTLLVATVLLATHPGSEASYLYPGGSYSEDSECVYPLAALPTGDCGDDSAELPQVNISAQLLRFGGIDQTAFTFTASVELSMVWLEDLRGVGAVNGSSKCKTSCSSDTLPTQTCCDNIWRPTLVLDNALKKTVEIESYYTAFYGLDMGLPQGPAIITSYTITLSGSFDQPFEFAAFPFDRHALSMRIACEDCQMQLLEGVTIDSTYIVNYGGGVAIGQGDPDLAATFGVTRIDFAGNQQLLGTLQQKSSGKAFPPSSGWQLDTVDIFVSSFDRTTSRTQSTKGLKNVASDPSDSHFGVIFVTRITRVTRVFYTLQCIIPPIILVTVGFSTFIVAMERFTERLKPLVALLFPLYAFQYSLTSILPRTLTMLSPNYLVFVSMVVILLLIGITTVSYSIVNRQNAFKRNQDLKKGRNKWAERKAELFMQDAPLTKPSFEITKDSNGMGNDGMFAAHKCACLAEIEKKEKADKKKAELEQEIKALMYKRRTSLKGIRRVRMWWSALALDGIDGYRQHIASIFECIALSIVLLIYIISVLALFMHTSSDGADPNQV